MHTYRRVSCAFLTIIAFMTLSAADGQVASTAKLAVSPAGTISSRTLLTIIATVTDTNGPVLHGAVIFYNGSTVLGSAQLISGSTGGFTPGTAAFKTRSLTTGAHSLMARFTGTKADISSTTTAQGVTVTGPSRTVSALTAMTNAASNYSLNAVVTGVGAATPTGNFIFKDETTGTTLGMVAVTTANTGQIALNTPFTGICSAAVAMADMNGDGLNDLVAANELNCGGNLTPGSISVLAGKGDGTLQTAVTTQIPYRASPVAVAIQDLNGDGIPDIVVADVNNPQFWVLLGKGDGTFQTPVSYNLGYDPEDGGMQSSDRVLIGDFDGDGIPDDFVMMQPNPTSTYPGDPGTHPPPSLSYLALGNGDGTFQMPVPLNRGLGAVTGAAAADVNGDGRLDLIFSEGNLIVALLGNGDGTFKTPQTITSSGQTSYRSRLAT